MEKDLQIYADDARGIYIPQYFATSVHREFVKGVEEEDWGILESGPDNEFYWEAWDSVLKNATLTDSNGDEWTLYQDGALFLVPDGYVWHEDKEEEI